MRKIIFVAFLFIGSLVTNVQAQTHLKKWVEKCETVEGVDYSIISKKDRETKKVTSEMISISFNNNPKLLTELLDAAAKDREDAIEVIENKVGGILQPQIYKFYDSIKKQDINYIFSITKKGSVSLVITNR